MSTNILYKWQTIPPLNLILGASMEIKLRLIYLFEARNLHQATFPGSTPFSQAQEPTSFLTSLHESA